MHIYIYTHIFIHGQYEVFIFSDLKDVFSYLINMPNLYCNHSHLYKIIGLFFILFFSLFLADKNKREKKKKIFTLKYKLECFHSVWLYMKMHCHAGDPLLIEVLIFFNRMPDVNLSLMGVEIFHRS